MNTSDYLSQLIFYFQENNYQLVIEYCENILNQEGDDNTIKVYLALGYFCLGDEEYIQTIYLDLLLNDAQEELQFIAQIIFNLGQLKFEQQEFQLATQLYQQSLEFDNQYIPTYLQLAECLSLTRQFEQGISLWEELIILKPDLIIIYEQLGQLWQNISEYEKAIAVYQQGLQYQKNNLQILANLACCCLQNNQFSLAKKY